ncbi:MAG: DegT/DnrJ/EryC1/StrS family aminotransferase [Acidobacteriota bacterium]|nr:DegT/DnrJ/EryC1/StrS family aminotransferase [Acidobacteriota bacterium]
MNVPSLDLKAQYRAIRDEINQRVLEVLASQNLILGAEVESLEKEIAALSGVRHGIGVSSGSDALLITLMAMDIGPGDRVITTPFTFFATAGSIARLGAVPVFCDIDEKSYNLSPEALKTTLKNLIDRDGDRHVRAVLPVHLYGQCADMDAIRDIAAEYDLRIIEDACQAVGSEYPSRRGGVKSCAMGNAGALSFYPTKNLGGLGDGGMVLTDDAELAGVIRILRVHGESRRYYYDRIGGNFRMDAIQAAGLRVKLKYLETWQEKRREHAAYYRGKFEELGLLQDGFIEPPAALYEKSGLRNHHTYHQYVIRTDRRDELLGHLKAKNIGAAVFYPLALHQQKCFSYLGYKEGDFPASEKAAREVLSLPIHPELTVEQQDYIAEAIRDFYRPI